MKKFLTAVAVAATILTSAPALATESSDGHWEWQAQSQRGPRSTQPAFRRVWVGDAEAGNISSAGMETCNACPMSAEQQRPTSHRG